MAVTGKVGADAIFILLRHSCHIILKYNLKLNNAITAAQTAGAITVGQAATCSAFVAGASAACAAFEALAAYTGF